MSFQAYLDTIKAKTGKDPAYFLALAQEKGFLMQTVQTSKIIEWLARDYDLGRGHAMSLIVTFNDAVLPAKSDEEQLDDHFRGKKATWRQSYEELLTAIMKLGNNIFVKMGNN